jgi:signal peptidase II
VRLPLFYFVALVVLALDQITKWWISSTMSRGESRSVIGDVFRLTYVHNDGAAFGLDLGGRWAFVTVTVAVILFIVFSYSRTERRALPRWALALVLGGALGNLVDRIRIGEVIDFFQFGVAGVYWPIFNVADIGVSVGVGLLAVHLFRKEPDGSERANEGGDETGPAHDPDPKGT